MVAGKPFARRSGRGERGFGIWSRQAGPRKRGAWGQTCGKSRGGHEFACLSATVDWIPGRIARGIVTAFGNKREKRAVTPLRPDRAPVRAGDGSGWSSDRLLELVRYGGRPPSTSSPSTWSSSRSLLRLREWKPRLEEGFALRCLQRLSFPDLATRRCPERDSRHTRGRSSPILSY